MNKILVTGGTGLIGKHLIKKLKDANYEIVVLTRKPKNSNEFRWNISKGYIDEKAFENVSYMIHLAGAGIADKRWSKKRKQEIIDSRILSTNLLFKKITELKVPLKAFIGASAIGFYGAITSDKIFTEKDISANDFLGNVCKQWENTMQKFACKNIRTVMLRTGVVLTKKGGALEKMKLPIITPISSGKQYLPWIHIEDLCNIYLKGIEDDTLNGIYNAVAPEHHTNKSFSKELATSLKRLFLPIGVPAFILKIVFGEMSVILLKGSRINSNKIKETSFKFQFPKLREALENLK